MGAIESAAHRPLPNAAAERLADSAIALDSSDMIRMTTAAIAGLGVVSAWEQILDPVRDFLNSRTDGWDAASAGHPFARSITQALHTAVRSPRGARSDVLLACADEEDVVLPVETLAAAIAESGVITLVLGARVPPSALATAAARLSPRVVVLWSHHRDTADPAQILSLAGGYAGAVVAAGPGWDATDLPPSVLQPADVSTALVLTLALLEAADRHLLSRR